MAARFTPILNAHLRTLPRATLSEKKALSSYINAELRALGLSIKCPKSGRPAIIWADFQDAQHEGVSRFRLEARREEGRRGVTSSSFELPQLELMSEPERSEPLARPRR